MVDAESFEWDPAKDQANRSNHGVSFEDASSVFYDPLAIIQPDHQHSRHEDRSIIIGVAKSGRVLVVAFTQRCQRWRIISARRPTPRERNAYEAAS